MTLHRILQNSLKVLIVFFISLGALAQPTIVVKGIVQSFDQKKIVLKNGKATINVPRSSYPDLKKVTIGRTVIEVQMTPKEALDYNPQVKLK